jgi:hypothetical protein
MAIRKTPPLDVTVKSIKVDQFGTFFFEFSDGTIGNIKSEEQEVVIMDFIAKWFVDKNIKGYIGYNVHNSFYKELQFIFKYTHIVLLERYDSSISILKDIEQPAFDREYKKMKIGLRLVEE